jgi:hypothetical protein
MKSIEELRPPSWLLNDRERLQEWIERAAESLGIEAKPVGTTYAEALGFVNACAPAVIRLDFHGEPRFLAVVRGGRGSVRVLTTELDIVSVPSSAIRAALCDALESPLLPEIDRLLDQAEVKGRQRKLAASSILLERLGAVPIQDCWILRVPAGASLRAQLAEAKLYPRLSLFLATPLIRSY